MQDNTKSGKVLRSAFVAALIVLFILLLIIILFSAGSGYLKISFPDVIRVIISKLFRLPGVISEIKPLVTTVIFDVRLPRIMTAAVVGAGLSISGAVYQAILLNPLSDPYTLGVSAGAAFGASLALLFFPAMNIYVLPVCAFSGALVTLFIVIFLSSGKTFAKDGLSSSSLILSGIIVASILSAGISFLKYIADEQVSIIIFWLMGSFDARTWMDVGIVSFTVVAGLIVIMFYSRDLNVISLGSRMASTLGVNAGRVMIIQLITASVIAAVCVSVSGIIGFVGLIVPHMMRSVTGPDNRKLIPASCLAGAILLLSADTVTRAYLPVEIPVGVLTALIGGPFFCYIFRKGQMKGRG